MNKLTSYISLLLLFITLPLLNSCSSDDDVMEILTGKSWKLARLTTKGSHAPFMQNLWANETEYNNTMTALKQNGNFTIAFEGAEVNNEMIGRTFSARAIIATINNGTWHTEKNSRHLTLEGKVNGTETDPLTKEFFKGLANVFKYEGDSRSITLYYKDGQTTKEMGFVAQ